MSTSTKLSELASRPATHLLSTRLDGRYLAALATYWSSQGALPRSVSELARLSLEAFASLLMANSLVSLPTHSEALEILRSLGLTAKVNLKSLQEALIKEDLDLSSLTQQPKVTPSPDIMAELERRLQTQTQTQEEI